MVRCGGARVARERRRRGANRRPVGNGRQRPLRVSATSSSSSLPAGPRQDPVAASECGERAYRDDLAHRQRVDRAGSLLGVVHWLGHPAQETGMRGEALQRRDRARFDRDVGRREPVRVAGRAHVVERRGAARRNRPARVQRIGKHRRAAARARFRARACAARIAALSRATPRALAGTRCAARADAAADRSCVCLLSTRRSAGCRRCWPRAG